MSTAMARRLVPLGLGLALACGAEAPRAHVPGERLLARVEARLARERAALRASLSHYGLVFPVEPGELAAFLRQVRVHGAGADLALGTELVLEPHGGGLLRVLFDHWRPGARTPGLADRYPFEGARARPSLGELYAAGLRRLFLPLPGVAAEEIGGRLPGSPRLPRMHTRFGGPGGPARGVESDAWKLLGLALELEPDAARTWRNRFGQPLSVSLLMQHVEDTELASPGHEREPADHSELHRIELLVAFAARHGGAPAGLAAVQRHWLEVELAERPLAPADAGLLIAHQVEALGHLLGAPALRWGETERARVRGWLAALEAGRMPDVEREDLAELCHLAKGLRAVRAHRALLE